MIKIGGNCWSISIMPNMPVFLYHRSRYESCVDFFPSHPSVCHAEAAAPNIKFLGMLMVFEIHMVTPFI
ncbi:hypothetical protein JOC77_001159 [Peribacillus deserti]|uniref:Uncharacterized protein n=1 Tax=Peribacillus deserti TaxID=673318 RepID=A0ABS2QF82_9BACI|nr:hypothetical protein [Peribacillus deserti]